MMTRLEVYKTRSLRRSQRWAWRLVASNGRIIATSGEGYTSKKYATAMGTQVARGDYDPNKGATP